MKTVALSAIVATPRIKLGGNGGSIILGWRLLTEFNMYLREKPCTVFGVPIDVCFTEEDNDIKNIKEWVELDLVVVCDKSKIHKKRIVGIPVWLLKLFRHRRPKRIKSLSSSGMKEQE